MAPNRPSDDPHRVSANALGDRRRRGVSQPPSVPRDWDENAEMRAIREELDLPHMETARNERALQRAEHERRAARLPRLVDPTPMSPEEVLREARKMFETPGQRAERERITTGKLREPRAKSGPERDEYERRREEKLARLPRVARIKLGLETVSPDERAEILGRQESALQKATQIYPTPKHTWTMVACQCPWRCSGTAIELQKEKVGRYVESTWRCLHCKKTWRTSPRMDAAPMRPVRRT